MLPLDIIHCILIKLDVSDLCELDCSYPLPDYIWKEKAISKYGEEFWKKAKERPNETSKPLQSWKEELLRIEKFQRMLIDFGNRPWLENDFYSYWNLIDTIQLNRLT